MAVVRLFVKTLDGKDAERELRKLLKRHRDKIVAIAIVMQAESDQQAGALARSYRMRLAPIPATVLLQPEQDRG